MPTTGPTEISHAAIPQICGLVGVFVFFFWGGGCPQ